MLILNFIMLISSAEGIVCILLFYGGFISSIQTFERVAAKRKEIFNKIVCLYFCCETSYVLI